MEQFFRVEKLEAVSPLVRSESVGVSPAPAEVVEVAEIDPSVNRSKWRLSKTCGVCKCALGKSGIAANKKYYWY